MFVGGPCVDDSDSDGRGGLRQSAATDASYRRAFDGSNWGSWTQPGRLSTAPDRRALGSRLQPRPGTTVHIVATGLQPRRRVSARLRLRHELQPLRSASSSLRPRAHEPIDLAAATTIGYYIGALADGADFPRPSFGSRTRPHRELTPITTQTRSLHAPAPISPSSRRVDQRRTPYFAAFDATGCAGGLLPRDHRPQEARLGRAGEAPARRSGSFEFSPHDLHRKRWRIGVDLRERRSRAGAATSGMREPLRSHAAVFIVDDDRN